MKKIITTLFLTSAALFGFGQSIMLLDTNNVIVSNTIIDVSMAPYTTNTQEILVSNTKTTAFDTVRVKRTIFVVDSTNETQFCWGGVCYGYPTNVSSYYTNIAPGDTVHFIPNGFHAIFNSTGTTTVRIVHYEFYDKHNITDSTGLTFRYNYALGVNEIKADGNIANAYPNPASSFVSIKYDMNEFSEKSRIIFYDVLGKAVKEVVLMDKQGIANINISDLNTGIYFYKFVVNDKAISTKKLVICSK